METGQTIANYTILRELGRGGMGVVWLARDEKLDRDVAIKTIAKDSPDHLARFQRESRILASLNHPSIASVIALETIDDTPHLVMEFAQGESLDTILHRGQLHIDDALKICAQIADAVAAAHDAGVIHRDLKPANVVVDENLRVKVLDFGLARHFDAASSSTDSVATMSLPTSPITREGAALGTPGYMSPEQARGRRLGRETDVFSFGCILFECLAGKRSFTGETATDAIAALIERAPDWSALPANTPTRVRLVLERCLQKDASKRLRDLTDAKLELETALTNTEWSTTQLDIAVAPRAKRSSAWLIALLVLIPLLFLATYVAPAYLRPLPAPEDPVRFSLTIPEGVRVASGRDMNEIAISRDGRTIAYLAEPPEGNLLLYVQSLDEFEPRLIPLEGEVRGPSFSPDARWIYFIHDFDSIWRVPTQGGKPERIAGMPTDRSGISSVFDWYADNELLLNFDNQLLHTLDTTTGQYRELINLNDTPGINGIGAIRKLPGSNALLLHSWDGHERSDNYIARLDLETSELVRILERASDPFLVGDEWLVFLRDDSLYAVPIEDGFVVSSAEPRMVVDGVASAEWSLASRCAIAPSGTIAFVPGRRESEGSRIASVDREGNVEYPLGIEEPYMSMVAASPDGSRIAAITLDNRPEIRVYDLQTNTTQRLVTGTEVYVVVFSSDSNALIFQSWLGGSEQELVRWNLRTGEKEVVIKSDGIAIWPTQAVGDSQFLSIRGDWNDRKQNEIVLFDLETKDVKQIIEGPGYTEWNPFLSPDGQWLAYGSDKSGAWRSYIRAYPDGKDWLILDKPISNICWSPDGARLYFLDEQPIQSLCEIDFVVDDNGNPTFPNPPRTIHTSLSFNYAREIDVNPDDKVLFIDRADWEKQDPRLRVITNFTRDIERAFATEN